MKKGHITYLLSLAVLFVFATSSTALGAPLIKNIRFDSSTPTVDRIIFELTGPYLPTGNALPGSNPRIYFDFPKAAPSPKVKNRIATDGNFIKQIRHAYHKGPKPKTRVVFDLIEDKKMDIEQDFDKNTNTLTISLYPAGTKPEPSRPTLPAPKPAVAKKPTPKPVSSPPPPPAAKPEIAKKAKPTPSQSDVGKKIQPMAEVSIPPKAEPKSVTLPPPPPRPKPPVQATVPAPNPEPVAELEPEPTPQPEESKVASIPPPPKPKPPVQAAVPKPKPEPVAEAKPEPAPQPEAPKVASIPPPSTMKKELDMAAEEATDISPMAEIGATQDEEADVAPILNSIEFDPKSKRGETISFKLNGFHPPVVFGIEEDVPRIVCFFKNAAAGEQLRDVIGTGGQHVRTIKVGKYHNPDNIRVVLELTPGYNYDLQQVFFKDDNVFMLIVNRAGRQAPSKNT